MSQDDAGQVIPFYSLKLRNLVEVRALLVVWCSACRSERRVDPVPVIGRRGPDFGVRDLEKVFTCSRCGRKGFGSVRVEWL